MEILICLLLGYLLGTLNPAAMFAKLKKVNLRETGTHNLGASNALLTLGRSYGAVVMVLDILKAYTASRIAKLLFPHLLVAGLLAGLGAILGHVFPFYMHFQGGKGLAAFGGMVIAYEPMLFAALLSLGLVLMVIVNYSFVMPMSASVLFVLYVAIHSRDPWVTLVAVAAAVIIIAKHWSNIGKARRGEEMKIRDIISTRIFVEARK